SLEWLELSPPTRVPLPYVPGLTPRLEGDRVELPPMGKGPQPSLETLGDLHTSGRLNFLEPERFGLVKDREHVSGFGSHQFDSMLQMPLGEGKAGAAPERWALLRLELMSLLKHERPAIYVSDHLPQMDDLKKSATRTLSPFEDRALKELRNGEDLVTDAT